LEGKRQCLPIPVCLVSTHHIPDHAVALKSTEHHESFSKTRLNANFRMTPGRVSGTRASVRQFKSKRRGGSNSAFCMPSKLMHAPISHATTHSFQHPISPIQERSRAHPFVHTTSPAEQRHKPANADFSNGAAPQDWRRRKRALSVEDTAPCGAA